MKYIQISFLIILILSCDAKHPKQMKQLEAWDILIEKQPKSILDSLKTIQSQELNRGERAYFYLLETAAKNKLSANIDNDSTLILAEEYFTSQQDYYNTSRCLYYRAQYLNSENEPERAFQLLKQAEGCFEKSNSEDQWFIGMVYYWAGQIQSRQNNLPEAQAHYQKAIKIFSQTTDTISLIYSLRQSIRISIRQKDYTKARELLDAAFKILASQDNQKDEAIVRVKASILNAENYYYYDKKDYTEALISARECISTLEQQDLFVPSQYYYSIITIFQKLKETDSIKHYSSLMIPIAQKENDLYNQMNGYKFLYKQQEEKGNYKEACKLREEYNNLKDEYGKTNRFDKLVELEKKYNLSQKEKELLQTKNKNLQLIVVTLTIFIIVLVLGFYFKKLYRRLSYQNRQLAGKIEKIKWGFVVSKALISDNSDTYKNLELLLTRYKIGALNPNFYNEMIEVCKMQRIDYTTRLYFTLCNVESEFVKALENYGLNQEEIVMTVMLLEDLNTKEIADLLRITTEAVRKRKIRLEMKVEIDLNISLETFLEKIKSA